MNTIQFRITEDDFYLTKTLGMSVADVNGPSNLPSPSG